MIMNMMLKMPAGENIQSITVDPRGIKRWD